jgi:hypothetical protein
MSKPWKPPRTHAVQFGKLRWTKAAAYWRDTSHHRQMPAGAKAGLLLVAAACVGVAIGAYDAFGPRHIVDDQVAVR